MAYGSLAGQLHTLMQVSLSAPFLQVLDSKWAESWQCHNLFTAEVKSTVCKIPEVGKSRNICWDWEQFVAWEQCSRRPAAHQLCPHLLLTLQLMLVTSDIFAEYKVTKLLSNGLNQQKQIQLLNLLHICVTFRYAPGDIEYINKVIYCNGLLHTGRANHWPFANYWCLLSNGLLWFHACDFLCADVAIDR